MTNARIPAEEKNGDEIEQTLKAFSAFWNGEKFDLIFQNALERKPIDTDDLHFLSHCLKSDGITAKNLAKMFKTVRTIKKQKKEKITDLQEFIMGLYYLRETEKTNDKNFIKATKHFQRAQAKQENNLITLYSEHFLCYLELQKNIAARNQPLQQTPFELLTSAERVFANLIKQEFPPTLYLIALWSIEHNFNSPLPSGNPRRKLSEKNLRRLEIAGAKEFPLALDRLGYIYYEIDKIKSANFYHRAARHGVLSLANWADVEFPNNPAVKFEIYKTHVSVIQDAEAYLWLADYYKSQHEWTLVGLHYASAYVHAKGENTKQHRQLAANELKALLLQCPENKKIAFYHAYISELKPNPDMCKLAEDAIFFDELIKHIDKKRITDLLGPKLAKQVFARKEKAEKVAFSQKPSALLKNSLWRSEKSLSELKMPLLEDQSPSLRK